MNVCPYCEGEPYERGFEDEIWLWCSDCDRCLEGTVLKYIDL